MNPPHLYTNNIKSSGNNYSRPNIIRVAQIQVQRWVIILSFIQLHFVWSYLITSITTIWLNWLKPCQLVTIFNNETLWSKFKAARDKQAIKSFLLKLRVHWPRKLQNNFIFEGLLPCFCQKQTKCTWGLKITMQHGVLMLSILISYFFPMKYNSLLLLLTSCWFLTLYQVVFWRTVILFKQIRSFIMWSFCLWGC